MYSHSVPLVEGRCKCNVICEISSTFFTWIVTFHPSVSFYLSLTVDLQRVVKELSYVNGLGRLGPQTGLADLGSAGRFSTWLIVIFSLSTMHIHSTYIC
jgi:hypothetical protein